MKTGKGVYGGIAVKSGCNPPRFAQKNEEFHHDSLKKMLKRKGSSDSTKMTGGDCGVFEKKSRCFPQGMEGRS